MGASVDLRSQIVAVAQAEKDRGVVEDVGSNEDGGGRIRLYMQAVRDPRYDPNRPPEPWCADFVSWVYEQVGSPLVHPKGSGFAYAPWLKSWLQENGFWRGATSEYEPQPGDIAIFQNPGHAGIVKAFDGTYLTTLEGNLSDALGSRRIARDSGLWDGFGCLW